MIIMKTITSILVVLSLAGAVAPAFADNDNNTSNLQDLERQSRAGNPG
jgi:hypothetical protein